MQITIPSFFLAYRDLSLTLKVNSLNLAIYVTGLIDGCGSTRWTCKSVFALFLPDRVSKTQLPIISMRISRDWKIEIYCANEIHVENESAHVLRVTFARDRERAPEGALPSRKKREESVIIDKKKNVTSHYLQTCLIYIVITA